MNAIKFKNNYTNYCSFRKLLFGVSHYMSIKQIKYNDYKSIIIINKLYCSCFIYNTVFTTIY